MKATGIVRRIDDLGRIVIPKEIRRTLHIRETDPMEIFTDAEGQIILKKYSPIGDISTFAGKYAESLSCCGVSLRAVRSSARSARSCCPAPSSVRRPGRTADVVPG